MVGGLAMDFQYLYLPPLLDRKLGQQILQHRHVDQSRATADDKDAVRIE